MQRINSKTLYAIATAFLTAVHATSAIAATCSMFATQAEAQAYFIKYKAKELDRDKDGEACECLLCGSIHLLNHLQYAENGI